MTDNILEAMRTRRSVRTFDTRPLSDNDCNELAKTISEVSAPFGPAKVTIGMADVDAGADFHPGTYGVIKNARTYLIMSQGDSPTDELSAGFMMEQVVLRAWELGLGTCWLGGTYRRSTFSNAVAIPADQKIRIVVPVGYPAQTRFMERLMRRMAGSDNRKPFDKLFFVNDLSTPLEPDSRFGRSLEMMRLAPSATNCQPWRAVVDSASNAIHFYSRKESFDNIDMGIGLAHFALAEQADNNIGAFFDLPDHPDLPDLKYVISYRRS